MKKFIYALMLVALPAFGQRYETIWMSGVVPAASGVGTNGTAAFTNAAPIDGRVVAYFWSADISTTSTIATVANKGISSVSRGIAGATLVSSNGNPVVNVSSNFYLGGELVAASAINYSTSAVLRFKSAIVVEK